MNNKVEDATLATFVLLGKLMETLESTGVLSDKDKKQTIANALNVLHESGTDQAMGASRYIQTIYPIKA